MIRAFLLVFLALQGFGIPEAGAFDIVPEYQGLSENDLLRFETPVDLDSEYQTVFNGYAPDLQAERRWLLGGSQFDGALGSLGNKDFLHHSRARLERELWPGLTFKFVYFVQRDREVDQVRHVLELSQRIFAGGRIAVYGDPSAYKRETDVGVAMEWKPVETWQNRFYYTLHDVVRNDHNDQQDRFEARKKPTSLGWLGVYDQDQTFGRAGFRIDTQAVWVRPQESRVFHQKGTVAFLDASTPVGERLTLETRSQWDNRTETQDPLNEDLASREGWRRERLKTRLTVLSGHLQDPRRFEYAFTHSQRRWEHRSGLRQTHYNELPSLAVNWRGTRRRESFDRVRLEYEMNFFKRSGDLQLSPTQKARPLEQRLQLEYRLSFAPNAHFALALNLDMDEWSPVPTFEGGNGRLHIEL